MRPVVEEVMSELSIPPERLLINVGDDKLTSNDDIREFNNLDTASSEKQIILLVNKGKEGWNCRSLFGVALYRSPRSRIFVLQATMRCLRAITHTQQTGRIYLSDENATTLENELKANHRLTLEEFQSVSTSDELEVRVMEPLVTLNIKKVRREYSLEKKTAGKLAGPVDFNLRSLDTEHDDAILRKSESLEPGATIEREIITDDIKKVEYSAYSLISEVVRVIGFAELHKHFGSPAFFIEDLSESSVDGMELIVETTNRYNIVLHDKIIPELVDYLFEVKTDDSFEEETVQLAKPFEEGTRKFKARPGMYIAHDDSAFREHVSKSFHLSHYIFDSNPEKQFFEDVIRRDDVERVYFTGMLTHGQSEFRIPYIDPITHTVRHYYPDFLIHRNTGEWHLVEIKRDDQIEDPIVKAKQEYASMMGEANQMQYSVIAGKDALNRNYNASFDRLTHNLEIHGL